MPSNTDISPLGPIDPSSVSDDETQKSAPWIVRKLVGVRLSLHSQIYDCSTNIDRYEKLMLMICIFYT